MVEVDEPQAATETDTDSDRPVITLNESDSRSIAIIGIFVLLVLYTLYFAATLLIPITLALLLSMLFQPVVTLGNRYGIPAPIGALAAVGFLVAVVFGVIYGLSDEAAEWLERIPRNFFRVEQVFDSLKQPLAAVETAAQSMSGVTRVGEAQALNVRIERPGIAEQFLTGTPRTLASIGLVLLLTYFLLAAGDNFLRKTLEMVPSFTDKKRVVEIARSIQTDIAYYLMMLTGLNAAIGLIVWITCLLTFIPNAELWGVASFVLSFAPFVGPILISAMLIFVGLLTHETLMALVPAGVYLIAMFAANNGVIPLVVGMRLAISPLAIFMSIVFWGWMWGVAGALLAVPLLAAIKITCDRVDALQPVARYLEP
jgi:predicted PurR-regulated permease PerM